MRRVYVSVIALMLALLAGSGSSFAQTAICDGLACNGSGFVSCNPPLLRDYVYRVTQPGAEHFAVGTHDADTTHYTDICMPAGWNFHIDLATPIGDYSGVTPHTMVSPGPDNLCPYIIHFVALGGAPLSASPTDFGFNYPGTPHDVDWDISNESPGIANWSHPVGTGTGPVHGPQPCTGSRHGYTCIAGRNDNFIQTDGVELADPSPALQADIAAFPRRTCNPTVPNNWSEFDCDSTNTYFGHSFTVPNCLDIRCRLVEARLCFRLAAMMTGAQATGNDDFFILEDAVPLWSISMNNLDLLAYGDGAWRWGDTIYYCLDLSELPVTGNGPSNILAYLQDGDLDVRIRDETDVDYLQLFIETCCGCVVPPADMANWWSLDETSGTISHDQAGWNNIGTHEGSPTPVPGMVDGALWFNGAGDYVRVPDQDELDLCCGDFTIDAWVQTTGPLDAYPFVPIVDKRSYDPVGYMLFMTADGYLGFHMADGVGTGCTPPTGVYDEYIGTQTRIDDGSWHHVAVTVKRATASPVGILYVDGIVEHVFTPRLGILNNNADLRIGLHHPNTCQTDHPFWYGSIDEVEMFHRFLSDLEIQSIFNARSAGKCKGPVGNILACKFDDMDMDGVQDPQEAWKPGVTLVLNSGATAVTGVDGCCLFEDLPVGTYTIWEQVASGMLQTGPQTVTHTVTVRPFMTTTDAVFGNIAGPIPVDTIKVTSSGGDRDNFVHNGDCSESASPSAMLQAVMDTCSGRPAVCTCPPGPEFDCAADSQCFGHTFSELKPANCYAFAANLEGHLKATGASSSDDVLHLLQNANSVWSISLSSLNNLVNGTPTWEENDTCRFALNLANLPPEGIGPNNILMALQDGDLDVLIEDATAVDYLELIVDTWCNCLPPPDSMVNWWPFDSVAGLDFDDIAGTVNNVGTYQGTTPTVDPGRVDGALILGGSDYVSVPDGPELDFGTGDLSIDAWIQTSASGIRPIVDSRTGGPLPQGYILFLVNGQLGFQMADGIGADCTCGAGSVCNNYIAPGPNVADGTWHHVAVTVDRDGDGVLYVDGNTVHTFTPRTGDMDNTEDLWIGRRHANGCAGSSAYWIGGIDELEMFPRALSASEVFAIAATGGAGKCKSICYCPYQGDIDANTFIDAVDLSAIVDIVFFGAPDPQDPDCPSTRADFNCDGFTDSVDLSAIIDYVFFGGPKPCDACTGEPYP